MRHMGRSSPLRVRVRASGGVAGLGPTFVACLLVGQHGGKTTTIRSETLSARCIPCIRHDPLRWRYRTATFFGQLVERTSIKRIWAHDLWHLSSRLLRKVLMRTLAVCTNVALDRPPLHVANLIC